MIKTTRSELSVHAPAPCDIPQGARRLPLCEGENLPLVGPRIGASPCGKDAECPMFVRYVCEHGHRIKAVAGSSVCGYCPICMYKNCKGRGKGFCVAKLKKSAAERGGTLVSCEYHNSRTPVVWKCAKGHVWEATADNVVRKGSWCPTCAKKKKRLTLEEMKETAEEMGGWCLSEKYIDAQTKLTWRCAKGHTFDMAPNNVRRRPGSSRKPSWCPVCARERVTVLP